MRHFIAGLIAASPLREDVLDAAVLDDSFPDRLYASTQLRQGIVHALLETKVISKLIDEDKFFSLIGTDSDFVAGAARSDEFLDLLTVAPEFRAYVAGHPSKLKALLGSDLTYAAKRTTVIEWLENGSTLIGDVLSHVRLSEEVMAAIRAAKPFLEAILSDDQIIAFIRERESTLFRIFDNATFAKLETKQRVSSFVTSHRATLARVMSSNAAIVEVFSNSVLLQALLSERRFDKILLDDTERLARIVEDGRFRGFLLRSDAGLASLLKEKRLENAILQDRDYIERLLKHGKVKSVLLTNSELLAALLNEQRALNAILGNASIVERLLRNERAVKSIAANDNLVSLIVRDKKIQSALIELPEFISLILSRPALLDKLISDPRAVTRIVRSQGTVTEIVSSAAVRNNVGFRRRFDAESELSVILARMGQYLDPADKTTIESKVEKGQLSRRENLRDFILDTITENHHVRLGGGRLRFPDRKSLWTLLREIFVDEDYYFESRVDKPLIIDGGAHVGFATYFFKLRYPRARVIAFEPFSENAKIARENIEQNKLADVDLIEKALASFDGDATLFIPTEDSMGSSLTKRRVPIDRDVVSSTVACARLSPYLKERVDFLKLDIEGSEDSVLVESSPLLSNVHQIAIEFHDGQALERGRLASILSILSKHGFRVQVAKSHNCHLATQYRPMQHLSSLYSAMIWGINENLS